ncbi:MAG: SpoVR family protein [Deltaproteobacteria bacterium]|nr:SpoVR family protein [Deltaproteobacteria bacterium]
MGFHDTQLNSELEAIRQEIENHAKGYGLDFFPVIFEMLDWKEMNMLAAYGGFPNRYPHWRFGMEFERLSKSYSYGLSKIYEMVINNDPSYAYLLNCNRTVDQKMVMAHVYGHVDFFKNNAYFAHTSRKMMDEMANHKARVKRHINKYGYETVEKFLDICLSLENLVDHHGSFIKRVSDKREVVNGEDEEEMQVQKLKSKPYMDRYINPKKFLDDQQKKLDDEKKKKKNFPESPVQDVLGFLLENAPLENWERDLLDIVMDEAYYFLPQGQTKIMNEGWASFWHSKIMTQKAMEATEIIDFADHHAGTMAQQAGRLNPYKLGIELFRDIEDRWNRGKFGKEYEECDDYLVKKNWNRPTNQGLEKTFEVRRVHDDVTFIDTFLTEEFCREQKFFAYMFEKNTGRFVITSREFNAIKQQLLASLTNWGQPFIYVTDANFGNRGELYLTHRHEGMDLKMDWAESTLKNLFLIWRRPVSIETLLDGKLKVLHFDGQQCKLSDFTTQL